MIKTENAMRKLSDEQRIQDIFMAGDEVTAKSLLMKAQTIVAVRFPPPAKIRKPKVEGAQA